MATFNLTKQLTNPASSSTQNITSGDTINFTITLPSGISDTTPEVFANATNCSLNQSSDSSSPFTFTATNFTSSTYSVQFSFVDSDSNTTSYSHTVSGSVSPGIVAPTISGTTFLYYNGETRAAFVSGSTYYVQTRINLSSNGSGGTLEYGRNTSSNTVSGATWQTSNTWNHLVGGTRYYWASQDRDTAGSFDSTGGVTYNYVSPNTVTVADGNVASGATSKTITITNTTNDYGGVNNRAAEAYSISTVDHGSGEISASTVSASRIGVVNSPSSGSTVNFTISSSLPGSAGGSTQTYYVYAYRRPDWSGKAVYYKTDSFVLTRDSTDTTPENYTNLAGNVSNASLSTYHYATFSTTTAGTTSPGTGFDVGTTISNGTSISISNGEYSLNAGGNWLTGNATINQNQVVYFRGQSSSSSSTTVTHSLTLGSVTRSFTTTTAQDTTPDQFTFTDVTGVSLNSTQTSNQITISGITGSVAVSVTGGTYSKNGGAYTSSAGTASVNDTFRVRHTSSSQNSQSVSTTLTVGTVSDVFTSTTVSASGSTSGYGIEIYDTDGATKVVEPGIRFGVIIASATNVTLDSSTTFVDFVMDMTGISASTVSVVEISSSWSNAGEYADRFDFQSDRIRINKPSNTTFFGDIYIIRF